MKSTVGSDDCPMCEAGNVPKKVLYVDFARMDLRSMPAWIEAAKKADKVVYTNLELSPKEADIFVKAVQQLRPKTEVTLTPGTNRHERRKRKALDRGV